MHELSLAGAIHETVTRHAEGRPVRSVQMRIGRLRQVVPDSLEFYFGIVARDTPVEGAALELELVDALLRCGVCDSEWDPAPPPAEVEDDLLLPPMFRCPACEAGGGEVVRGEEFEVESIVVEDLAPAETRNG
ncbi:MAG TPA: hydrogenase maturation nickel metallochaperone HypA [Solirubrobacterales bacterium]|jgi:hydrogenase nickel incorporation protein HypA/HybF|nr:hydrogenase maturation nickel metallochaperone HypA [Solirubrobacterales bacterium]